MMTKLTTTMAAMINRTWALEVTSKGLSANQTAKGITVMTITTMIMRAMAGCTSSSLKFVKRRIS